MNDFLEFYNKIINKDKKTWDIFIFEYSNLIYYYIRNTFRKYNFSPRNDEAKEIFNEIIIRLLRKNCFTLKKLKKKNNRSFISYLDIISSHLTIDFLRKQRKSINLKDIEYIPDSFDFIKNIENEELIKKLVKKIPNQQRYLFKLIFKKNFSLDDITKIMSLNKNAIGQLKFRMIHNLRKIKKDLI